MTPSENEDMFVSRVKAQLDDSVAELEPAVLSRLRQARYEALHPEPKSSPWLWPVSGLATACTAVLVALLWWNAPTEPILNMTETAQNVEDLEVLIAADQLDLYEDLEFYGWLAEHERAS